MRGALWPNLQVINPKNMLLRNPEMEERDAIQEASWIVIVPVGNGDSIDVSRKMLGLDHPDDIPMPTVNKFTE